MASVRLNLELLHMVQVRIAALLLATDGPQPDVRLHTRRIPPIPMRARSTIGQRARVNCCALRRSSERKAVVETRPRLAIRRSHPSSMNAQPITRNPAMIRVASPVQNQGAPGRLVI